MTGLDDKRYWSMSAKALLRCHELRAKVNAEPRVSRASSATDRRGVSHGDWEIEGFRKGEGSPNPRPALFQPGPTGACADARAVLKPSLAT